MFRHAIYVFDSFTYNSEPYENKTVQRSNNMLYMCLAICNVNANYILDLQNEVK